MEPGLESGLLGTLVDGERAYRLLKQAQNITDVTVVSMDDNAGGVYENLFCAHPSFQIDGNFGATAGIAEMMLQNTVKGVHLLPAFLRRGMTGHFKGLKAKGGFVFDVAWKDGKMVEGRVYSAAGQGMPDVPAGCQTCRVKKSKGGKVAFTQEADGAVVFPTSAGRVTVFVLNKDIALKNVLLRRLFMEKGGGAAFVHYFF